MPVMRLPVYVAALCAGVFLSGPVWGYGSNAHIIIGDIAWSYLCEPARDELEILLDGERLGGASRWPDWIRSKPEWAHTSRWHYINVDDDVPVERVWRASPENVLQAIDRFEDELADRDLPDQQRARALKFLAHFIGDVHQPLHVGRGSDRGGNSIDVRIGGRSSNLHKVWDAQSLLRMDGRKLNQQVAPVAALAADSAAQWRGTTPPDWARESQNLRPVVYDFGPQAEGQPVQLSDKYLAPAHEITQQRLAQAGVRLAETLNHILCNTL